MTDEIHLLVKGGTAPKDVRVDTGIKKLKPLVVQWTWCAWDKLKRKQDLVKDGWLQCAMADVLDEAYQREAMRFCMGSSAEQVGEELAEQLETGSDAEEEVEEGVEADGPEI